MLNAQCGFINSIRAKDGMANWRAEINGTEIQAASQVFSPPALGSLNMYLCGAQGHLISLKQQAGAVNFAYAFGTAITFQPALAGGNIYFGTVDGKLICLRTNAKDADG